MQFDLTMQSYRLGIFGFLASDELGIHGNYGFKDQACAFMWVRGRIFICSTLCAKTLNRFKNTFQILEEILRILRLLESPQEQVWTLHLSYSNDLRVSQADLTHSFIVCTFDIRSSTVLESYSNVG
jgi:hypothetical protein